MKHYFTVCKFSEHLSLVLVDEICCAVKFQILPWSTLSLKAFLSIVKVNPFKGFHVCSGGPRDLLQTN